MIKIAQRSKGLTRLAIDSIHDYFLSTTVTTEVTIDVGQSDTAGGSTTNEGSGSGIGDPDSGTGGLT